jgi:hypothetical protein
MPSQPNLHPCSTRTSLSASTISGKPSAKRRVSPENEKFARVRNPTIDVRINKCSGKEEGNRVALSLAITLAMAIGFSVLALEVEL